MSLCLSEPSTGQHVANMLSWVLNPRQLCDIELMLNGGFSPLTGFLSEQDYASVLGEMKLTSGALWPIPINLDVSAEFAKNIVIGDEICLRNTENNPIAILKISDCWVPDKSQEAMQVFGTGDLTHPGVNYLYHQA